MKSSAILGGDGFGMGGGLVAVLGLSCAKISASLASATAVGGWPYTLGAGLYNSCVAGCWLCTLGAVA